MIGMETPKPKIFVAMLIRDTSISTRGRNLNHLQWDAMLLTWQNQDNLNFDKLFLRCYFCTCIYNDVIYLMLEFLRNFSSTLTVQITRGYVTQIVIVCSLVFYSILFVHFIGNCHLLNYTNQKQTNLLTPSCQY
jgi:hypothetical protein